MRLYGAQADQRSTVISRNGPGGGVGEHALVLVQRLRRVRVVRDYGMFDRREAPQYYPAVERKAHSL